MGRNASVSPGGAMVRTRVVAPTVLATCLIACLWLPSPNAAGEPSRSHPYAPPRLAQLEEPSYRQQELESPSRRQQELEQPSVRQRELGGTGYGQQPAAPAYGQPEYETGVVRRGRITQRLRGR